MEHQTVNVCKSNEDIDLRIYYACIYSTKFVSIKGSQEVVGNVETQYYVHMHI